ncbi:proline--tRNA ligase [Buchnera aphidicola]|uniref:Proline--tRNA ligase n=1 Tax=Buchnera aphidicola subsp. Cinara cedri (strain Cc) TaxID=372461 RepID=Q057S4_BUCCC|nr:proline--tRNA ligase [Buchnera aphidicola]ABJ90625.1 prolyl-tRNA synthetase [Buchnera aphidicola BCc]
MYTKKYLLSTLKEKPKNIESISHQLMLRSGMIRMLSSGIYTWLPTGYRIIKKITKIISSILNNHGCMEICMPIIQPENLWKKSGRKKLYGEELIKITDRRNKKYVLSPTHEEAINYICQQEIHSYKQLPITFYQIQKKFRDEIRPRFGVIRTIEFLMKDAYSFHINKDSLKKTYENMKNIYIKIFKKLKLNFKIVKAHSKIMGGSISDEFHAISEMGENKIIFLKKSNYAFNYNEFNEKKKKFKNYLLQKEKKLIKKNSIEIGHIFQIEKKYSKNTNFYIQDKKNKKKLLNMGCYGIGINRIISSIIEQNHDKYGIIWPNCIAPFQVFILPINMYKNKKIKKIAKKLYKKLINKNIDVLFDNRNESLGKMFADMNLIGIPFGILISKNTITSKKVELYSRKKNSKKKVLYSKIISIIKNKII